MIILGSTSPRRKELLTKLTSNFRVIAPLFDEHNLSTKLSRNYALEESYNKAFSLKDKVNKNDCLICVDTIVYFENKIYGKPKDLNEARLFLGKLSNKKHEVISGYTIFYKNEIIKKEVTTYVEFNKFSEEEIINYINSINVLDKAGAYSIQDDKNFHLIKKIEGSFSNVMGFPLEEIKNDLEKFNLL